LRGKIDGILKRNYIEFKVLGLPGVNFVLKLSQRQLVYDELRAESRRRRPHINQRSMAALHPKAMKNFEKRPYHYQARGRVID